MAYYFYKGSRNLTAMVKELEKEFDFLDDTLTNVISKKENMEEINKMEFEINKLAIKLILFEQVLYKHIKRDKKRR